MSKKIVTIYKGDDWHRDIPKVSSPTTKKSFEDWHKMGSEKGVEFFRASIQWFDVEKGVFEKAWAFRDGQWVKVDTPFCPDMIFDKVAGKHDYSLHSLKQKISRKVFLFNNPEFRTAMDNKLTQYIVFQEFMAKSVVAENPQDFLKRVGEIEGSLIVSKPLYGSGGFGIVIADRSEINHEDLEYPVLLQEFIENKNGIPGFSEENTIADLRMVYINHKLIYSLSRIAKEGSLFTNFHQGATAVLVPEEKIPESAIKMAEKIAKKLSVFSKAHYSLDFIFDENDNPRLVEINTTPGFDLLYIVGDEKLREKNFDIFVEVLE